MKNLIKRFFFATWSLADTILFVFAYGVFIGECTEYISCWEELAYRLGAALVMVAIIVIAGIKDSYGWLGVGKENKD